MFGFTRFAPSQMSAPVTRFLSKSLVGDAELENRSSANAFVLKLHNGDCGTVEYAKNDNVYDLLHSNIPVAYRGLGYGHILAKPRVYTFMMFTFIKKLLSKGKAPPVNYPTETVNKTEIEDWTAINAFMLKLNGDYSVVRYEKINDLYLLLAIEVPPQFRGKGYAYLMALKTFDYIASKNMKMKITCEFLQDVYRENKNKYEKYYVP